ncbi:hypothetical protein AALP_AA7G236500 [Arabis alpina]|uniref:TIR domain-containing protein n=1 Tax=Arabis alpina TaxID=50452 RepID=A0A087GK43_ARAAL|nr:hypothetical protein AALP_AA7G236500 [Arabis alpina]
MDSSSSSSTHPSSLSRNLKHHVFPSFYGPDVRNDFLNHILKEFSSKRIDTIITRGESIGLDLMREIRGSKIAIVILSRNYASSSWCLDELVEIMKCREVLGQVVVPIFYKLDSIDVKKQTGDFGNVFRETCFGKTKEDTERWRQALAEVATIAGYSSLDWDNQQAMIEKIATHIYNIFTNYIQSDIDGQVGMEAHLKKMEALLGLESDEARMIGIWGPSGIGKTTIARCLFNHLSHQFPLSVFMENIKGPRGYDDYSAKLQLQKDFLCQILNQKDIMIPHLGVAQDMLKDKKLLAVLDGVDSLAQLDAMAKETRWFGPGSRIIITTQDHKLLIAHGIDLIYEVMGSYLRGMSKQEWTEALPRLRSSKMGSITKDLTDLRQELFITNQDLKEYSSTSERYFEDIIYIYCEDRLQYSFASHLSMGFRRKRIDAFVNSEETLDVFDSVNASVVIFSKSCFSSTSYLDMLVRVLQCQRKTGQLVVPVFYGISPSDVVVHEQESGDQIREWSSAIQELRELPGHQSREECTEREFVEKIVKDVYEKLFPAQQIGINSRLLEIEQLLCKQPWGIRRIGIWAMKVIDFASGNPLALSFYGKELKETKLSEMETSFLELKLHTPYKKIHDLFKSSYETLNDSEKNIFLDIACFFVGEDVDYVLQLLEGCGFFPHVGIDVLVEKCLVTISENRMRMHRIIQDFGREVINGETVVVERRSRLWEPLTIKSLLEDEKLKANGDSKATYTRALGTEDIEAIYLDTSNLLFDVKPTAFENMLNLRLLKIFCSSYETLYGLCLPKGLQSLPCELRLLHWEKYPLQSLPQDFDPDHLVELNMSYSKLHKVWTGSKNLDMLKIAKLCHSQQLIEVDDICKAQNIELIDLEGCTKLQSFPDTGQLQHLRVVNISGCREIKSLPKLPASIGKATNLEILDFGDCSSLIKLPSSIGNVTNLHNLQELDLNHCPSLLKFPSSSIENVTNLKRSNLTNLKVLDLSNCRSMMEFPASIEEAINLEKLTLKYCSSLVKLPFSIGNAISLKELYLTGCSSLMELPASIGNATNLEILDLGDCLNLIKLPSSIGKATNLEKLYLEYCLRLEELPFSIGNATNLRKLSLAGCSSLVVLPSSIGNATNLQELNLEYCSSLVELPSSFGNAINLKKLYLTGCSSLVELPSSIRNSTSLIYIDLEEDNNLPTVNFSYYSKLRYIEVRRAKRGNFFVLKGEQNDENSLSLILRIVYENGRVRNLHFLFYKEDNTASKASSVIIKELELTDQNVTFIAEMIDILLVNMIPTWKTDVKVDHLIHSQLNQNSRSHQNEANTKRQEETAVHDGCESFSHPCSQSDEEDKHCVDAIEVEDGSSNQEGEDATKPVSLKEEEILSKELEEIEAKYQDEMKKIARKREETIMETKKKRKLEYIR